MDRLTVTLAACWFGIGLIWGIGIGFILAS